MDKKKLIAKPILLELDQFNIRYKDSIFSENQRIQEIIDDVVKSDGKQIRPILLLLAAKACGKVNEITYLSAITVELLHTASLIHDDVVDESKIRRGRASVNAMYDNKVAILAGDYFLSTALIKSILTADMDIISSISNLGRSLAEGELNQLSLAKKVILEEEEYFEVIKKKTASLLSVCMKIGAISAGADDEIVKRFELLGKYLGICFQLKDDIFDYYPNDTDKPIGNDISRGKITLPLLYALKQADNADSLKMIEKINNADFSHETVSDLISFAKVNGGIEYTYSKIEQYRDKALQIFDMLPENGVNNAFSHALDYVVERAY